MRINRHTIVFFSLSLLLISVFALVVKKYYPFLSKHLVYYCQHTACTYLVQLSSNLGLLVFKLLLVTIALTVIKLIVNYLQTAYLRQRLTKKRIFSYHKHQNLIKKLRLDKVAYIIKDKRPFAFCLGFLRPKIVLSTQLLSITTTKEFEAILRHENYHLQHKDALLMLIANITKSLFPFFPIIGDYIRFYGTDREVLADQDTIAHMSDKYPLVNALKKLIKSDLAPAYSTLPAFTNADNLEIRIRSLVQAQPPHKNSSPKTLILSSLAALLLLGLAFAPIRSVSLANQGEETVVACMNTESCINICRQNEHIDSMFSALHPQSHLQVFSFAY